MNLNTKISVIVPVYKSEPYLDCCVQSIVDQTYENLEIILVDDESPDRCPEICDAWAAKDHRIRVIHQKNAGGGLARNAGLDVATGEMIAFVDSDDYIYPKMYEYLADFIKQGYDIAECDHQEVWNSDAAFLETDEKITVYTAAEAMKAHIEDTVFRQLIWNKLYRREIVGDIRFPWGKKIDDEFFTYQLLGNAKRLVHSNQAFYAYRQQEDSVMHSMGVDKRMQALEAKEQRHSYILEHFPALEAISLKNLWMTAIYQGQLAMRKMASQDAKQAVNKIRDLLNRYPIHGDARNVLTPKEKLWICLTEISLSGTCRLRNAMNIGL